MTAAPIYRSELPTMTEGQVLRAIETGNLGHLLGRNASFVMFPQSKDQFGAPDIRPVDRHDENGLPVVGGAPVNNLGTWIPLPPQMTVLFRRRHLKVWSLPLNKVQRMHLATGRAKLYDTASNHPLH